MEKEIEIWKDVIGYEGLYEVSSYGNLKSKKRKKEKLLKHIKNTDGYMCVFLSINNDPKIISIHRLMAIHFIDNPENKPEVNHKDGIRDNNVLSNLEWMTKKENIKHSFDLNDRKRPLSSRFNDREIEFIKKEYAESGLSIAKYCRIKNYKYDCLYKIIKGITYIKQ